MINEPLNSSEQSKVLIFTLILAPAVVFGVGVIPALFISFGVFMLKKHEDFSHIETAVRNSKIYTSLLLAGCVIATFYFGSTYGNPDHTSIYGSWYNEENFFGSLILSIIAFAYLIAVQVFLYSPLNKHSEWVAVNGIFSTKPKSATKQGIESEMDIIKGEKLKQYSVADELIKWAKLKEDGHITEDEFIEARAKLLKRN